MSGRAPVGVSARLDLFQQSARVTDSLKPTSNQNIREETQNEAKLEEEKIYDEYGLNPDDSPMQLEHIIGYSGDYRGNTILSPKNENEFIRSLGCLVSFENLLDSHEQNFLRGHDMPVSCAVKLFFESII